ncbi:MAG TPA: hypothetical protein VK698_29410 [Kofleriaceae bacterium]|nr:hypothetical protein [Kofleriaceae bacterium]
MSTDKPPEETARARPTSPGDQQGSLVSGRREWRATYRARIVAVCRP